MRNIFVALLAMLTAACQMAPEYPEHADAPHIPENTLEAVITQSELAPVDGWVSPKRNEKYFAVVITANAQQVLDSIRLHVSCSKDFQSSPIKTMSLYSMAGKQLSEREVSDEQFSKGYVDFTDINWEIPKGRGYHLIARATLNEELFAEFDSSHPRISIAMELQDAKDIVLKSPEGIARFQQLVGIRYDTKATAKQYVAVVRPRVL